MANFLQMASDTGGSGKKKVPYTTGVPYVYTSAPAAQPTLGSAMRSGAVWRRLR